MRLTALILVVAGALAVTACQKTEEQTDAPSTEAAEAAGVADPAAAYPTLEQAAAEARAAAESAAQPAPAPAATASAPAPDAAPAPEAAPEAAPAPAAATPAAH